MEDIYITGGSGFLGTHLAERLSSATPIPHQDITTTKLEKYDKFYFLSAYGNMHFQQEDDKILQANISDLIEVLKQTNTQKGFRSFTYISTSSVRLKRQTMYSRTKKAAEEILLAYMEKYNLPICIIRPFSITGVGEQKEHLIPKLIDSCLNGTKMEFVASPVHDYIDVDDVVEGILRLSKHGAKGIFELGTGEGISNQGVLELVEEITGKKANIVRVDSLRDYDNQDWMSGNFTAKRYGWSPKKNLRQSITDMVEAYTHEN